MKRNDHRVEVKVRSNDTNGRNLLANALSDYNWYEMESLGSVDQKDEYFNDCIMTRQLFANLQCISPHSRQAVGNR